MVIRGGERIFFGVSGYNGTAVAVGRIFDAESMRTERGRCIMCIRVSPDGELLDSISQRDDVAGIAVCARALSAALMELMMLRAIPYIILKELDVTALEGCVALLDTERGALIADPDIDTLRRYSALGRAERAAESDPCESAEWESGGRGVIVDARRIETVGDMRGALIALSELLCGRRISVRLETPQGRAEEESFCRRIEAVYLAAVYGSMSLELCGYTGAADIERAAELAHRVFCELESAGREFNGYIRKGLLIDRPVWLLRPTPFPRADHITLDLDRIIAGLVGEGHGRLGEERAEAVYSLWDRYFSRFAPECAFRVRSDLPTDDPLLRRCMARADVDSVYAKDKK